MNVAARLWCGSNQRAGLVANSEKVNIRVGYGIHRVSVCARRRSIEGSGVRDGWTGRYGSAEVSSSVSWLWQHTQGNVNIRQFTDAHRTMGP